MTVEDLQLLGREVEAVWDYFHFALVDDKAYSSVVLGLYAVIYLFFLEEP